MSGEKGSQKTNCWNGVCFCPSEPINKLGQISNKGYLQGNSILALQTMNTQKLFSLRREILKRKYAEFQQGSTYSKKCVLKVPEAIMIRLRLQSDEEYDKMTPDQLKGRFQIIQEYNSAMTEEQLCHHLKKCERTHGMTMACMIIQA